MRKLVAVASVSFALLAVVTGCGPAMGDVTGTVTISLIASERLGITFQANKVPIALHVEDVAEARTELESRGVEFPAETIDSGVCFMANFHDPDGNALLLHHRYAPFPDRD